ncbi:hypothetical protein D3C79_935960 [compost metagenome]
MRIIKTARLIITAGIAALIIRDMAELLMMRWTNRAAPAEIPLATINIITAAMILGTYP